MDQFPEFYDLNTVNPTPEKPSRNFCALDILKAEFDGKSIQSKPNEPVGIDEWHRTGRGDYLAKTALGEDPKDPASDKKLDDWISSRSDTLDVELRQLYNLPTEASKIEVVNAIKGDYKHGGHYCAFSQGLPASDSVYDGITTDIITSELSDLYNTRQK